MLERYSEIWSTVSNLIKKEFDCEPVYNDKYLKSRMKSMSRMKSIQIVIMTKFQKKILIVYVYQLLIDCF